MYPEDEGQRGQGKVLVAVAVVVMMVMMVMVMMMMMKVMKVVVVVVMVVVMVVWDREGGHGGDTRLKFQENSIRSNNLFDMCMIPCVQDEGRLRVADVLPNKQHPRMKINKKRLTGSR